MNEDIKRIDDLTNPNRCQGVTSQGQCINLAVEGGTFCLVHGGNKQLQHQRNQNIRNYRAGVWQARIQGFTDSSQIKDLREEIGILRLLIEERLNFCEKSQDLIFASGVLSDLIMKVEKVVSSCHKLEASLGQHLDKASLMSFASQVINIISISITDRTQIDKIANGIINLITEEQLEE